jgi:hypothetical protein
MNDVFFFFSRSKKKTFCIKKNLISSFLSVLLKILLEAQNSFERSNSPFWTFDIAFRALLVTQQKKTKKKKLIIKREKKTIIKKSKS